MEIGHETETETTEEAAAGVLLVEPTTISNTHFLSVCTHSKTTATDTQRHTWGPEH